jgi:hypothetical protein
MRSQRVTFLFTSSAPTTTLFSSHIDSSHRPASLLASALVHATVFGLISYGILTAPATINVANDRFAIRHLDLRMPEQRRASRGKPSAAARQVSKALQSATTSAPTAAQQAIHVAAGPQTLLQPDLPIQTETSQAIPVPRVLIWTPRQKVVKNIIAPQPAPPASAQTRPSLDAPSPETDLADFDLAASNTPTPKLPVLPSTTTPIVTLAKNPIQTPPSTTTQQTDQPTPTAVLSISDLQMQDGPVTLPPVNESVRSSNPGTLLGSPAATLDAQDSGTGNNDGTGSGNGADKTIATGPAGTPDGIPADSAPGAVNGNGDGNQATTTQITLPRDGTFSSVIVGETIGDQFPEIPDAWSGRIAYTVYLHVGLARSWILQYSLPRDVDAAAAGNANRIDAPWPYSIVRPNLTPGDVNADALMIHGFVDESGHFDNLSIVFPQACPEAPFVLSSLKQWQFRPASENGQVARVEVLLIIPEELE